MSPSAEEARLLLRKAQDDRRAVEQLAGMPSSALWIVGFHAQQVVEKAMKAVLALKGIPFARTHNLIMLAALLGDHGIPAPGPTAVYSALTPFGTAFRYDDASDPDEAALDVAAALDCAAKTLAWAGRQVDTGDEK